jgi:integrase
MPAPPIHVRGAVWYADLRAYGGQKHTSLGLPAGTSQLELGMAVAAKVAELRVVASIGRPPLPGLESPGLLVRDLVSMYQDARDYDTKGGEKYGADCAKRVREGLGHLTVNDLAAPQGAAVLRAWRDRLWKDDWKPRSVRNVLNFAAAVLRWGQDDGRALTGAVPRLPKFCRPGEAMSNPRFVTFAEADFRSLREHVFDEALRRSAFGVFHGDRAAVLDYVARRKLYLSLGFYTGAHPADLQSCKGAYLNVQFRRYERHNTKSARVVEPEWFDMPEQLALDCQAELDRRGLPRFPPEEIVTGGFWRHGTRAATEACRRLWPDGSRPHFDFRTARRSMVWEYTIRGWRTHEIAAIAGHVDEQMIREVYRRCSELGIISPVRVPWTCASGPHGRPSATAPVLAFQH